jgi:hypothetical protein
MGKMLHFGKDNSFTAIGLDNSGAGAKGTNPMYIP